MRRALATALFCVALCGSCKESLRDTGFVGQWSRNDRSAVLRIGDEDGVLTFCVENLPLGHAQKTVCDGPDRSVVYQGAEPSYAYEYRVTEGEGAGEILLEASGAPVADRPGTPIRWTDRLRLEPGGLAFVAHTVERNGVALDPPAGPYLYNKLANRP